MSLVTLRKYFKDDIEEDAQRRLIAILLEGIVNHAVRLDDDDYKLFRREIEGIEQRALQEATSEGRVGAAGSAVSALEAYSTTRVARRNAAELQNMIAMLAQAVITISSGNERSANTLYGIKRTLEHAAELEDVKKVRERLGSCLQGICEETARQKQEAEAAISEMRQQIQRAQANACMAADMDLVTGLRTRGAAEAAMRDALSAPGKTYIAVMVMERLQSINARFGNAIGDQLFRILAGRLQDGLKPGDRLFRWSGPTLLMMLTRTYGIDQARSEVRGLLDVSPAEFDLGRPSISIGLSTAWTVVGLIPPLGTILKHLETFIASQTPRDYC